MKRSCPHVGTAICHITHPEKIGGALYRIAMEKVHEQERRIHELEDSLDKLEVAMRRYVNKTHSER